jgi:predicted outer membrane repeat protein
MSLTVGGDILLENTRFLFCSAVSGGAVYVNTGSRLFARSLTVENCSATLHGGGIFLNASSMTMEGASTLRNNTANTRGGAVYAISAADVTLGGVLLFERNAVLSTAGNIASYGGALFASSATVTMPVGSALTFLANSCVSLGGAMVMIQVTLDVGGEINFVGATLFCTASPALHTPEFFPPESLF